MQNHLIKKYNVAGSNYSCYPELPYWNKKLISVKDWKNAVKTTFDSTNQPNGISIYIHLPFCESRCTYCGCNNRITVNHNVETKYIAALHKEWKMYLDIFKTTPNIREIYIGGGTPTFFSPENLKKLILGITSTATILKDADLSFEGHPNNTTFEHLKTLYDLGFRKLSLGIQDFDIRVQTIINRIQPFENVEKVVNQARNIGYTSINFDILYGLPLQSRKTIIDTINKAHFLRPDRISFLCYNHQPLVNPSQKIFTETDLPLEEEKTVLYEIGKEKFFEMGYSEIGMDHFALKTDSIFSAAEYGNLHHNFMGYTRATTQLTIGLGVSAISDSQNALIQNTISVEDYYAEIENNHFPIIHSHKLSSEDLIIRKHLQNIMCKFGTSWDKEEEQTQAVYDAVNRLRKLEKDKIITLSPYNLKIKKAGRPFIRNICMAFDAKLWQNLPKSKISS